jgi:hypothetical protein
MSNKPKHPPRMQAVIELGPFTGSPYANWGVYEIAPDSFEEPDKLASDLEEVDRALELVDTGDSPFGPFPEQVRRFLQDAKNRLTEGEAGPIHINRTLPYDDDLRARRQADDEASADPETAQPRDLDLCVIVSRVEADE